MPDVSGIHHVSVTVTDIERSVPWYSELSPVNDQGGYAVLVFRDPDNIQLEFMSMG